jgi:hypothetical protein
VGCSYRIVKCIVGACARSVSVYAWQAHCLPERYWVSVPPCPWLAMRRAPPCAYWPVFTGLPNGQSVECGLSVVCRIVTASVAISWPRLRQRKRSGLPRKRGRPACHLVAPPLPTPAYRLRIEPCLGCQGLFQSVSQILLRVNTRKPYVLDASNR